MHGNLPALEAVLDDCPADRFLLGGDHVGFGAWPRETAERLRQLDAEWIRGNVDRWLVDAPDAPEAMRDVIPRSRELAGKELCEELAAMPESIPTAARSTATPRRSRTWTASLAEPHETRRRAAHGGRGRARRLRPHPPPVHARRGRAGSSCQPGQRRHPARRRPPGRLRVVGADGGVELRRVEYDWQAAADEVRAKIGELPAKRIEQARFDVS